MATCEIIIYKGKKITYTNIENTTPIESIEAFKKAQEFGKGFGTKEMYSLVNAKNAKFNASLLSTIKETAKANNEKVVATAICGLNSLTKLMVDSIIRATGREMKLFDDAEEAKDWLVEH